MRVATLMLSASLLLPAIATAQKIERPPSKPTEETTADSPPHTRIWVRGEVVIGERAPDFEVDASNGRPLRLSSLRGDWALLLFDSRKEDVAKLRRVHDDLRSLGVREVAICDEKAYHLESFSKRENFPFLLLADPTGEVSAIYGLYDSERFTTAPGFVLLDRDGVVRMALLGQRVPPEDILRLLRFAITGF